MSAGFSLVRVKSYALIVAVTPVPVRNLHALNVEQARAYVKLSPVMTVAIRPVPVVKRLSLS